jgi:hypothetical protein
MATTPTTESLIAELDSKPDDWQLRERAARALQREGRDAEVAKLLTGKLRNLTGHEPPPLPCLCRKCLKPELTTTEALGFTFDREFAVAEGRVLFYWVPRDLRQRRKAVRASVQTVLGDRLGQKKKKKR